MFFVLSKTLDILLSPLAWIVAFILVGIPFRKRPMSRKRSLVAAIGALTVLFVFSSPVVADRMFAALEDDATNTFDPSRKYDAVVLLGGMSDMNSTRRSQRPSFNEAVERVLATYDVLASDQAGVAIASGGPDGAGMSDAEVARDQLVRMGIAADRVIVEDKAMNTRENATYVAEIMKQRGFERVVIVTSAYHMVRSVECFRAVGLTVDTLPVDFIAGEDARGGLMPRAHALDRSARAIREAFGRVIYRLMGYAKR